MKKVFNIIITMLLLCSNVAFAQMPGGGGQPPMGGQGGPGMGGPGKGGQPPMGMPQQKKANKKSGQALIIKEAGTMFIYGIALNPTDSVVYLTDELMLENAQIYKKTKFLVNREEYSIQLKNYMDGQGEKNRTCAVTTANSIKALDKKYKKQIAFFKKHGYLVKYTDQSAFRFTTVRRTFDEIEE